MTDQDSFFAQPTLTVARHMLGMRLVRHLGGTTMAARIVEVEAYHQDGDQAAHSYGGKTRRNAVMFGPPGFLYVYFIYGMHFCMNAVTEPEGTGAAVLIRGLEPLEGIEKMRANRGAHILERNLTNGPAKACAAFAIGRQENGISLKGPGLCLDADETVPECDIATSPRIGISKSKNLLWRFCIKGNPFVSRAKWS